MIFSFRAHIVLYKISISTQPTSRSRWSGVWFSHMLWGGLEWFMSLYLIKIVWGRFGLDLGPLAA